MTTAARTYTPSSTHWYYTDGRPCYELAKKDGKGMKSPTLADARKLNLLPSVTSIINLLDKPALTSWKVEQGVLAVLTTPRQLDPATGVLEADDAFVHRVMQVEKVQDEEAATARDKGTAIHDTLEAVLTQKDLTPDQMALLPWIAPAVHGIRAHGKVYKTEQILVGDGFAGRTDLILEAPAWWEVWDFKSTKKLPDKGSWDEHVLQLAAYAAAFIGCVAPDKTKPVKTFNCYISTVEEGKFAIFENNADWAKDFAEGFMPLVRFWQWKNNFKPAQ